MTKLLLFHRPVAFSTFHDLADLTARATIPFREGTTRVYTLKSPNLDTHGRTPFESSYTDL